MGETPIAFTGGSILTMDRPAEAVVVVGERIAEVGPRGILERWPGARIEELGGRTLVPGFIDAHNHLSVAALHPRWADLTEVTDLESLAAALRAQAHREPEPSWIRGHGWEWSDTLPLHRTDLDALGLDRPVAVTHFSLHQGVVCSHGLERLGIGRTTPDPPGGEILRDADGEPTGVLVERAWSQAHAQSLAAYADPDRWPEHIAERARVLLAEGITAVHDAATSPAAEDAYRTLAAAGQLPISVLAMPHPAALFEGLAVDRLDGPPTGEGDEWLQVGAMKLFADGGAQPAVDAHWAGEHFVAGLRFPDLATQARTATERGFRVAVHAMGNVGLEATLDAFTELARDRTDDDHRFRVEHVTLASRAQIRRMRGLGAVGVVQPGFLDSLGTRIAGIDLDEATWMPFATLREAGVPIAGSSDDPCGPWAPLRTSLQGIHRRTPAGEEIEPQESVSYDDWLEAYTMGAAHAGGQEAMRGSITAGKRADLVVLDGDLDPNDPPAVAQTWVAGRRRH